MSFEIVYTDNFKRELKRLIKKHRSIKNDLKILIEQLEENPEMGVSIGSNCFKIRLAIASKRKGKSSGARIITQVFVSNRYVYLLSIYDKSDKENIRDKELKKLLISHDKNTQK